MKTKFKPWVRIGAKSICILVIGMTLITKLLKQPEIVEQMAAVGLEDKLIILILIESVSLLLYIIPRTANIGFFLLCAYYGGAIAINLPNPINAVPAVIFMIIIWIMTFLRMPHLFGVGNYNPSDK